MLVLIEHYRTIGKLASSASIMDLDVLEGSRTRIAKNGAIDRNIANILVTAPGEQKNGNMRSEIDVFVVRNT